MGIKRRFSFPKSLLCVTAFVLCCFYVQMVVDKKSNDISTCIQPAAISIKEHPDVRNKTSENSQKSLSQNETVLQGWNKTYHGVKTGRDSFHIDTLGKVSEKPTTKQESKMKHTIKPKPGMYTYAPGMYTYAEFKQKAQDDSRFLMKILTQSYMHSKSYYVLRSYFTGSAYSFESEFKNVSIQQNYDVFSDVMIFLHIQKTGGMHFNDRLIRELAYPFKCKCGVKEPTCPCLNPNGNIWVYTSKLSGWPCGLHADWTQLHRCIPNQIDRMEHKSRYRRYFYFTQLRDPLARYMSEYFHQSFVAGHWQDALLGCGSGFAEWTDIRPCFLAESWRGVSLDDFMDCKYNLANNRMTRMLADLTLSDCYADFGSRNKMRKRSFMWLDSAKYNLQKMEYFGIMENKDWSDALFSTVFRMGFKRARKRDLRSHSSEIRMTEAQFLKMVKQVELDIHLYLFAKDLFERRIRTLKGLS